MKTCKTCKHLDYPRVQWAPICIAISGHLILHTNADFNVPGRGNIEIKHLETFGCTLHEDKTVSEMEGKKS